MMHCCRVKTVGLVPGRCCSRWNRLQPLLPAPKALNLKISREGTTAYHNVPFPGARQPPCPGPAVVSLTLYGSHQGPQHSPCQYQWQWHHSTPAGNNVCNVKTMSLTRTNSTSNCHRRLLSVNQFKTPLDRTRSLHTTFTRQAAKENLMNVFDRNAKRLQRNRTAILDNYEVYDYIKEEIGWRMADRICDIKRKFEVAVDLGCGRGHVSKNVLSDMVGTLYMTDMAEKVLAQAEVSPEVLTHKVHADEEYLPFRPNSLDLVISSLSLHWINDLPGTFKQIHNALKNDGCFLGSMFGGDTLYELRVSLQQAETEREGGFAPHISPFTSVQDLGNLLNRAGYTLLTIDTDEMVIGYPSMFELMQDLKGMGENNCSWNRRPFLPRDTQLAAAAIYQDMYGNKDDKGVPATFQFINFIGWKPDPSQPKPAARGSGEMSLKDLDKVDQLARQISDLRKDPEGQVKPDTDSSAQDLAKNIEKLRQHVADEAQEDGDDSDKK